MTKKVVRQTQHGLMRFPRTIKRSQRIDVSLFITGLRHVGVCRLGSSVRIIIVTTDLDFVYFKVFSTTNRISLRIVSIV